MDKTKPCVWCGKTYDEHADAIHQSLAVGVACKGVKSNFSDTKTTSPVRKPKTEQVTMTFGEALEKTVEGARITRIEWNNVEEYGVLQFDRLRLNREGKLHVWDVSDGDILATDWIILPHTSN